MALVWALGTGFAAGAAGFADTHAPAISVASLVADGKLAPHAAAIPILAAFSTNTITKMVFAFTAGGPRFDFRYASIAMPSHARSSSIAATNSGRQRAGSRSSIRSRKRSAGPNSSPRDTTQGASSRRIGRVQLLTEPPSIDGNELTDKGYINQKAGLTRRAALVDRLYAEQPTDDVIVLK